MAQDEQPTQIELQQQLVDLARQRTSMAQDRSRMSADRSRMSAERSRMSAQRSEMSAERSYLATERTLSVWVRTALSLMVFGLAIDRFGLTLLKAPTGKASMASNAVSAFGGVALVAFGVLMVVTTGFRFLAYARSYRAKHKVPHHHGPFLAPLFALLVALFGIALLVFLLVLAP